MKEKKDVLLLYLGGTLGMVRNSRGENEPSGIGEALRESGVAGYLDLRILEPLVDSSQLDHQLVSRILAVLKEEWKERTGFLIVGGTDTMAYLASLLQWMIPGLDKPIILTGAMKTLEEDSLEGPKNLAYAYGILVGGVGRGFVSLAMNGRCFTGGIRKADSTSKDAFAAAEDSSLERLREARDQRVRLRKEGPSFLNLERHRIEFLWVHPLMESRAGLPLADGLLLGVYGQGTLPEGCGVGERILEYQRMGLPVAAVSQVPVNQLDPSAYAAGRLLRSPGILLGAGSFPEEGIGCLSYAINSGENVFEDLLKMNASLVYNKGVDQSIKGGTCMKAKVDKDTCIGCENCVNECPEVFEMEADGLAVAKDVELDGDVLDSANAAKDSCPVEAISIG